ncbi:hypothetical protein HW555_000277 [Spodoptera exigua]|uniref:Uncharacterized protein n=1 Tax=Spodoptera exigua TaxID=7107 RepID=A0A835LGS2_SPOEX|nr:hypothetical protein HW555_000277 [Spodoptera exigua]
MSSLYLNIIFLACSINIGTAISIRGIVDTKNANSPLLRLPTWKVHPEIKSEGIFERFVRKYLDMLSTAFTGKQLIRYCRMMSKELSGFGFKYTEQLAKHFRYLSRMYRDGIEQEMAEYRKEYDEKLTNRQIFLDAMNDIFTLQENLRFDDYIHDMVDFGNDHIPTLVEQTRNILRMIVDCVHKLSAGEQKILEKKLVKAIKEYDDN